MNLKRCTLLLCGLFSIRLLMGCGAPTVILAPIPPAPSQPPPVATQGGTVTLTPQYAAIGTGQKQGFQATVNGTGALIWQVNGVAGGNATVGTIDAAGNYTAPGTLKQSENVIITAALSGSAATNYATAVVSVLNPGEVDATANPQVALYTMYLPAAGKISVDFGPTTSYGLPTWQVPTPTANGGQVQIFVAGMKGSSDYHLRAHVVMADGATYTDSDHPFTTGAPPTTAPVQITQAAGSSTQPGIELFDTLIPHENAQGFATDLAGNVIWTYTYSGSADDLVQPVTLLPNGNLLVVISYASSLSLKAISTVPGTIDEVREVDLSGGTVRSVTQASVASALASQGYNLNLHSFHHDALLLPNGHMVVLCTVSKVYPTLPGEKGPTDVLGDVLIDVDQNGTPDWVWNTFDHLDVNRHPFQFPDWTHSNALLYSAADHNLLLSIRHQNWIVKIDFQDGKGSGNILWRLGQGGDFKLQGGVDPTDWFYAQHGPNYFSSNTTGVFTLGVMDDGDDRVFPPGVICGAGGAAPCFYSSAPVYRIDEAAMTATLVEHYVPPASQYSFFGGDVELMGNGDLEADFGGTAGGSVVQEVNLSGGSPQVVWQAVTPKSFQYRAMRLPSLYPGVQW